MTQAFVILFISLVLKGQCRLTWYYKQVDATDVLHIEITAIVTTPVRL